jgi:hypothetical protein
MNCVNYLITQGSTRKLRPTDVQITAYKFEYEYSEEISYIYVPNTNQHVKLR